MEAKGNSEDIAAKTYKVKIQPLSKEAFAPFGQVMEPGQKVFPFVQAGKYVHTFELYRAIHVFDMNALDSLVSHFSYSEAIAVLKGAMVLLLAPAPKKQGGEAKDLDFDITKLHAFLLAPGDVVHFTPGLIHMFEPVGDECLMVIEGARTESMHNVTWIKLSDRGLPPIEVQF